ncbi:class I SAM-dependent methyltransferase [uncultured Dokdonia sp.]|uniref:class I SAM-dependent methyltransferase n=1 Tax=uncultured Dokdonia sp. TaxID=575653 RepID=UPI00260B113C|nr:class I SAM-dependent methyltransferase [uncultured Dokdonia sp.]
MTVKKNNTLYRSDLFRHLDGIVTAPVGYELYKKGITKQLLNEESCLLSDLVKTYHANEGYLNVALRVLCSQGWLQQSILENGKDVLYRKTLASKTAFGLFHLYEDVVNLQKFSAKFHDRKFEAAPFQMLKQIFNSFKENYGLAIAADETVAKIQHQVLKHIEGIILGPTLVHLAMGGMFHKYFMQASFKPEEFHKDATHFKELLDILCYFELFSSHNGTYEFTEKGLFYAKRASAYGVTVSYIPTLRRLDELLFENPKAAKEAGDGNKEGHVDRAMNVWGSGGAHSSYFKVVDEIIIHLFNKPIEEQPKGILDMGCGNGAFLIHLYNVIEKQTLRGRILDEHPLILVGADYNESALSITKANLVQAEIWAKVVWGDIGNPDQLAKDLQDNYGIALGELLNVRSFLDHNRIWEMPEPRSEKRISDSTGAYVFEGERMSNDLVEDSLLEHIEKWAPYVSTFGLLVIELHTVPPEIVAKHIGKTAVTAYDATHGFSDQYIVEVPVFYKILAEAGLHPDKRLGQKFPNSELAAVTVNLFRKE